MKRSVVCSMVCFFNFTVYLIIMSATPGFADSGPLRAAYLPGDSLYSDGAAPIIRYVSETAGEPTGGSDKVIIYGCDGAAHESSTGTSKGQAELQGNWVGHEANSTEQWSLTFTEAGTFEIKGPGNVWYKGKFACDSNQDPKQLNFYIKQAGDPASAGQTSLTIYKLETNTLTCAISDPGAKARPGSFIPEGGTKILVVTKQ